MGGRGASSGMSRNKKGELKHKYGTEFSTVYQYDNIKFVKKNEGAPTAPMETMTPGRVYVTLNDDNKPMFITYYDKNNKRYKQIERSHSHPIDGKPTNPHIHKGYKHKEKGTHRLSNKEQKLLDRVMKIWYNHLDK